MGKPTPKEYLALYYGDGVTFDAIPTNSKLWSEIREWIPVSVAKYKLIDASNKAEAIEMAKARWE